MDLPKDVRVFIAKHFQDRQREAVLSLLGSAVLHDGTPPGMRVLRCALFASRGDLERLKYCTDLIAIDYRDVIVAGEYELQDGELVRVRNLSSAFTIEE